jgi:phycocyanobilin lyase alpha subunit
MLESSSEETAAVATPLTVEQAIANLKSEDLSLRYYAAWWLGRFRVSEIAAVEALIVALEDEDYRTELGDYPLRRNAARALGKLGDRRSVPGLLRSLGCSDYYVREAAAQSLGMLGDSSAIPALMELLAGGLAAAQQVPGRPHLTQPCEAVVEALGSLQAKEAVPLIEPFIDHPMPKVQYAALRAMYQLTGDDAYGQRLMAGLQNEDLKWRRVVLADLGAIGYLPAASAIARTSAESSFKLIALKGLLEHQLDRDQTQLSSPAIELMNLMDSLL